MMEWPKELLVHLLQALAPQCDAKAQRAWGQLACLACKKYELAAIAKRMRRPILLLIEVEPHHPAFRIPFMQATIVCIDVDWGDGRVDKVREKGAGYIEHKYAAPGKYHVRVFPATDVKQDETGLDHLGFQLGLEDHQITEAWWRPLREIVSLGRCGLRSLSYLFAHSGVLKVDLRRLPVGEIVDLSGMFYNSQFNQSIGDWNVSAVVDMSYTFNGAKAFNQPIGKWNVGKVTKMPGLFGGAATFNQPLDNWDVGNVTDMRGLFCNASAFNQPIGNWNVSNVVNMSNMFYRAKAFNRPIGKWNVSKVTNMSNMFDGARAFNQNISEWNVGNVTDMSYMFNGAQKFNQPIGRWNVSKVTDMSCMLHLAWAFNQPIDEWKASNRGNLFDQPSGEWSLDD